MIEIRHLNFNNDLIKMGEINNKKLIIYTAKAQADKAISSLKGILIGIRMDFDINTKEINELQKWVLAHKNLINKNPFNEFINVIELLISKKTPTIESIEDLFWLCERYETDNFFYNKVTADLQTLQGICHGILADGIINDKEIYDLDIWLENNEHLNTYYPYDEIRSLILSIVKDHKIDEEEKLMLKAYFNQFVKLYNKETSEQIKEDTLNLTITGICTSEPNITIENKTFCITGILTRANREELKKDIINFGGKVTDNVSLKTDYLIVGDNGNPAWAYSCYGRKVEKALSLRKDGHNIMLIHEYDFFDFIDDKKC
jgi:hypothetical protein